MKSIKVTIDEEGQIEIETTGFKGSACEQATKAMEQALGVKQTSKKKPEFYQEDKRTVSN